MTAHELLVRAHARDPVIAAKNMPSLTGLTAWLDDRVADGWLTKWRGRYYLTAEGVEIAESLGGHPSLRIAA